MVAGVGYRFLGVRRRDEPQQRQHHELELLTAPRATPRVIAQTLSDGVTDAVATAAVVRWRSSPALAASGRAYTQGKTVETCDAHTRACTPLPGAAVWSRERPSTKCPGSCDKLQSHRPVRPAQARHPADPNWSPGGNLREGAKRVSHQPPSLGWYSAHELFVWNRRTNSTRKLADLGGVSLPTWSANGRWLLYVGNDGLWLGPLSGKPTHIEYPLFPPQQWRRVGNDDLSYYGQIDWSDQFSWWSPSS